MKQLSFRTKDELERLIAKDSRNNFRNNYSETVRMRLAESYNIETKVRLQVGTFSSKSTSNVRLARVNDEIYEAVKNEADEFFEGNMSLTVRVALNRVYKNKC